MTIYYRGLEIEGTIMVGWEGDDSIPNGTRKLVDVDGLEVRSPDGDDLTELFTKKAMKEFENVLLEAGNEEDNHHD